jgi:uncharacterized protein (TIGR02284 family)
MASGVGFSRFLSLAGDEGESQWQSPDARLNAVEWAGNKQWTLNRDFETRENVGSPSKDMVEVEGTLRTIIESLVDGQEGFQKIGEELKDETLKRYFLAESLKRAAFRGELEEILHQEGVKDVKETGSAASAFVRMWTGLKTALGAGDASLLEAADEAEEATVQAYADALNKYLPEPIREVLGAQAVQVEASHEYVKAARAGNKSAS